MAKAKAKEKPEFDDRLLFCVNGFTLTGRRRDGTWAFECPDWPDVAAAYSGAADPAGAVDVFVRRALAGVTW